MHVLSSVACGGNLELTFRVARECGYEGVELLVPRGTTADELNRLRDKWGVRVRSIHGAPWTKIGLQHELDNPARRLKAKILNRYFGPLEENPGIAIARELRIPIILHAGAVLELEHMEKLITLHGSRVRVENCDVLLAIPGREKQFDGMLVADKAFELLSNANIRASICLDVEHMACELAACGTWSGVLYPEFAVNLDMKHHIQGWINSHTESVQSIHLCDWHFDGRGHLRYGEGMLPLKEIIKLLRMFDAERAVISAAPPLDYVVEVASSNVKTYATFLSRGRIGHGWALRNAQSFAGPLGLQPR